MSSILNDVKHALGLLPDDTAFDSDVIMHANSHSWELGRSRASASREIPSSGRSSLMTLGLALSRVSSS